MLVITLVAWLPLLVIAALQGRALASSGPVPLLALHTLAPMVPLALTMMPPEDLLKQLVGILF